MDSVQNSIKVTWLNRINEEGRRTKLVKRCDKRKDEHIIPNVSDISCHFYTIQTQEPLKLDG